MKKFFLLSLMTLVSVLMHASWSFSGGTMYFDNSQTQWSGEKMILVIGHSSWSACYEMSASGETDMWKVTLPTGWSDATFMAVVSGASKTAGNWNYDQEFSNYSGAYLIGFQSHTGRSYLLTPQSAENGCTLVLTERKKEICLIPGVWNAGDALFSAWAWETDKDGAWYNFTLVNDTLRVEINEMADKINFLRLDPSKFDSSKETNWDAIWDRIDNVDIDWEKALYVITDWNAGKWEEKSTPEPIVTKQLRLVPGAWNEANTKFAAWVWEKGKEGAFVSFTGEGDTLSAQVNEKADSIIFISHSADKEASWSNKIKETDKDSIDWTSSVFTIKCNGTKPTGTWDVFTPVSHWYLKADFNSWNQTNELVTKAGGAEGILYTTRTNLEAGTHKIKVFYHDECGDVWYGNNNTVTQENHEDLVFSTDVTTECTLEARIDGDYEFAFNPTSHTLSVTFPTPKFNWFVRGEFNNWAGGMLDEKDGGAANTLYFTKHLPAGKEYNFKILNGTDSWYSAKGIMSQHYHDTWGFSTDEKAECTLVTTIEGDYEFVFDTINHKLTVSFPSNPKQAILYDSPVKDNNPDVMLQAFYWAHVGNTSEDYTAFGDVRWAALLEDAEAIAESFDLVWLAPSQETADFTGYLPLNYSKQGVAQEYEGHHGHSPWGSASDLRKLIDKLHDGGAKVVADIVLNHSSAGHVDEYDGADQNWLNWETFDFGQYGQFNPDRSWITAQDERPGSIDDEWTVDNNLGGRYTWTPSEYNCQYSRDWAHAKKEVREMSRAYLTWMRDSIGYDGFRYDFMKGFHGSHLTDYNGVTAPYFSVSELFDGNINYQIGFLRDANFSTYVFDFPGKFNLYDGAIREYKLENLKGNGNTLLYGEFRKYAVTFCDNHDSFHEEGKSLNYHANTIDNRQAHQALAYLLSMPGVPCVVYPYWNNYKSVCQALIYARRAAGVHSQSSVVGDWAACENYDDRDNNTYYNALIKGTKGYLFLKLGKKGAPLSQPDNDPDGKVFKLGWGNEEAAVWYTDDSGSATNLDNLQSTVKVTKIVRDGQIFIQRGEELYTLQGTRVK